MSRIDIIVPLHLVSWIRGLKKKHLGPCLPEPEVAQGRLPDKLEFESLDTVSLGRRC